MSNEDLKEIENEIIERKQSETAIAGNTFTGGGVDGAIYDAKQKIIDKAKEKINDKKIIEKHSANLAKLSDEAITVETETQRLKVAEKDADNKVQKQEIKNRLIVLKAEAKRLKREQKQLNADQKAQHKKRKKEALWELYGDKLKKMKYDYVPNPFILKMLLFFDGIVSFFNGLGAVSTAIVKALKWILIIGGIVTVLMVIPVTRDWLLTFLQFK